MAMAIDGQQQQGDGGGRYKHYCRVCKKGFGCGRALGGHMRAHGIGDDGAAPWNTGDDDDDPSGEWDVDNKHPSAGSKRMYSLRANANRLNTYRVCENCGKEFISWKSFLDHGRCSSDDDEDPAAASIVYSPRSDKGEDDVVRGWSKGKRSRRSFKGVASSAAPASSSEEKELANCLVMLSTARVDPMVIADEPEESCASASKDEDFRRPPPHHSSAVVHFQAAKWKSPAAAALPPAAPAPAPTRGLFECKACKKVFNSHQALGGHRASHKKVKGCFAAKLDDPSELIGPAAAGHGLDDDAVTQDNNDCANALAMAIVPLNSAPMASTVMPLKKKSKVHECSICHRVFSSGQALGGHKRCHWLTSNSSAVADPATALGKLNVVPTRQQSQLQTHKLQLGTMFENYEPSLDLNLPAAGDELARVPHDIDGTPLRLDVPASIFIQTWADHSNSDNNNNNNSRTKNTASNNNNEDLNNPTIDDEADSKVKLAKLSELKDVNMGDDQSSSWLQVGIGSSANDSSDQP